MREPNSYLTCDLYLFDETEKAYKVKKKLTNPDFIWVPRSVTNSVTKYAPEGDFNTGLYRFCRMQVADWFVEKEDL